MFAMFKSVQKKKETSLFHRLFFPFFCLFLNKTEATNGLDIYEAGLFLIPNKISFYGPKRATIKSRQIVEASDYEMFVCGNVPKTVSQTADINSFPYIYYS